MVGGINIILWTIESYPGTPVSQVSLGPPNHMFYSAFV